MLTPSPPMHVATPSAGSFYVYPNADWAPGQATSVGMTFGPKGWSIYARLSFYVASDPLLLVVTALDLPGVMPTIFDQTGTNVGRGRAAPLLATARLHPCMSPTHQPADPSLRPGLRMQVLAYGSCLDGTTCSSQSTCAQSVSYVTFKAEDAWASAKFSTAEYLATTPGNYTVLVRLSSYVACGGSLSDCASSASLKWKLVGGTPRPGAPHPCSVPCRCAGHGAARRPDAVLLFRQALPACRPLPCRRLLHSPPSSSSSCVRATICRAALRLQRDAGHQLPRSQDLPLGTPGADALLSKLCANQALGICRLAARWAGPLAGDCSMAACLAAAAPVFQDISYAVNSGWRFVGAIPFEQGTKSWGWLARVSFEGEPLAEYACMPLLLPSWFLQQGCCSLAALGVGASGTPA